MVSVLQHGRSWDLWVILRKALRVAFGQHCERSLVRDLVRGLGIASDVIAWCCMAWDTRTEHSD